VNHRRAIVLAAMLTAAAWVSACHRQRDAVVDEAKAAGLTPADFPEAAEDYFHEIDSGVVLSPEAVEGRNTWLLWTAGDQAFWDYMANHAFGSFDLLKLLSSRPSLAVRRDNRFETLGVMNDPGFEQASAPGEYGLWLDRRVAPPEPFDPRVYGRPSGIVGLRLFLNPAFDAAAHARWDPERYFTDPAYYGDPGLVRPYRVGMACAFCHVGPNPIHPPADPDHPEWADLSTHTGAQYFRAGGVFANLLGPDDFFWQVLNAMPPGTVDTSFIATDNVFNPRNINAIYDVGARLGVAQEETLSGGNLDLPGTSSRSPVPHILKDGADSVGVAGALGRVYVSIGSFHQEWLRHFRPLVGGKRQTPFPVAQARKRSVYWEATLERMDHVARFFVEVTAGRLNHHRLADAPGGTAYLTTDAAVLERGRRVFADHCARCHSSKRPPADLQPGSRAETAWFRRSVERPDFLAGNFLSEDRRHAVSYVGTNACSTLARNALSGHVWNDFSSDTYKELPPVGTLRVLNPFTGATESYPMPAGGRGYQRTPSLIAIWSSAPFFHDNGLGRFTGDPSVAGRMAAFDDAAGKLLWPARRAETTCSEDWAMPFCGPIYRTTAQSWLVVDRSYLPDALAPFLGGSLEGGELRIGPIPRGTPIQLLASLDTELSLSRAKDFAALLLELRRSLATIEHDHLGPEATRAELARLVPRLRSLSTCLDYQVDRGHPFGTDLPDADKRALIELLKTL